MPRNGFFLIFGKGSTRSFKNNLHLVVKLIERFRTVAVFC